MVFDDLNIIHTSLVRHKIGISKLCCMILFDTMKTHSRIPTDEKPHKDDSMFSLLDHLKSDMRIPTGEKTYHCDVYNEAFSHESRDA